jgi:surfactin synthase thioesterase subunit
MRPSSVDNTLWLRKYHQLPDAVARLVCFPHAGGSASYYLPVSAALGRGGVEVVALQYPGRQDRRTEPLIDDVGVLADQIHKVLPDLSDRPTAFFGHSMGAVVAFEVARRLERDGAGPTRLFASGRRAPSTFRDEAVHRSGDAGIMAEMRNLNGTDSAVIGDEEMMRLVLPVLRADYQAIETYRCTPETTVRCPITVLVGDSDPKTTVDEARQWDRHTTGGFDLRVYGGGHFYLTARATEVIAYLDGRLRADLRTG